MHTLTRAAALALALLTAAAQAEDAFPSKPVHIIVPSPAGGLNDNLARGLAEKLTGLWKQTVLVENRPGAATILGADYVAKSAPDGLTLLLTVQETFVVNPHLYRKLPYDGQRDFTPITTIGTTTPIIVVPTSLGVKTLPELLARARQNPGRITYGSTGPGSFSHIATETLSRMAGVKLTHIPYKGSAPLHIDLMSGQLSMYIGQPSTQMIQQVKDGKLRFLAVATDHRLPQFPDLPTVSEAGVKGFVVTDWWGIVAPAGVPRNVVDKLHDDIVKVVSSPEYKSGFIDPNNLEPRTESVADFDKMIKTDFVRWKGLVEASGATIE